MTDRTEVVRAKNWSKAQSGKQVASNCLTVNRTVLLVGIKLGRTAFELKSFDFKGEFAPDTKNAGRQTQESVRDAALVRTVYENDAELHHYSSTDNFFYTVTNTDGDQLVQANDRTKSWITGAIEGSAWNAVGAQPAPNNAKSSYPDD